MRRPLIYVCVAALLTQPAAWAKMPEAPLPSQLLFEESLLKTAASLNSHVHLSAVVNEIKDTKIRDLLLKNLAESDDAPVRMMVAGTQSVFFTQDAKTPMQAFRFDYVNKKLKLFVGGMDVTPKRGEKDAAWLQREFALLNPVKKKSTALFNFFFPEANALVGAAVVGVAGLVGGYLAYRGLRNELSSIDRHVQEGGSSTTVVNVDVDLTGVEARLDALNDQIAKSNNEVVGAVKAVQEEIHKLRDDVEEAQVMHDKFIGVVNQYLKDGPKFTCNGDLETSGMTFEYPIDGKKIPIQVLPSKSKFAYQIQADLPGEPKTQARLVMNLYMGTTGSSIVQNSTTIDISPNDQSSFSSAMLKSEYFSGKGLGDRTTATKASAKAFMYYRCLDSTEDIKQVKKWFAPADNYWENSNPFQDGPTLRKFIDLVTDREHTSPLRVDGCREAVDSAPISDAKDTMSTADLVALISNLSADDVKQIGSKDGFKGDSTIFISNMVETTAVLATCCRLKPCREGMDADKENKDFLGAPPAKVVN